MEKNKRTPRDASRKALEIKRLIRTPKIDINRFIQQAVDPARKGRHTAKHGKPDRVKGLGKEVPDGTVKKRLGLVDELCLSREAVQEIDGSE